MPLTLPEPIAAYFAQDRADSAAIAACFTPDAVVRDEGKTYRGHDAIAAWKASATTTYTYVSEPFEVSQVGTATVVRSRVTGNFPGSPIDLTYTFVLADGLISSLEISL